jgi:hypothetical protein
MLSVSRMRRTQKRSYKKRRKTVRGGTGVVNINPITHKRTVPQLKKQPNLIESTPTIITSVNEPGSQSIEPSENGITRRNSVVPGENGITRRNSVVPGENGITHRNSIVPGETSESNLPIVISNTKKRTRSRSANSIPQENPLKRQVVGNMIIIKDRIATIETLLTKTPIKVNSFFNDSKTYAGKFREQFEILKKTYNEFIITLGTPNSGISGLTQHMNDALQEFHRKIQKYHSVIQCNASNQAIISTKSSKNISNVVNKTTVLSENNIAMRKSYVCSAIDDIVATTTNLIKLLQ